MSEQLVIEHCAPTLANLKTANLLSCTYELPEDLYASLRKLNSRLTARGVRALPVRMKDHRALVYLYRPKRLCEDFKNAQSANILRSFGYDPNCPAKCLARLRGRLKESGEFPHEIGLFLGYPPEDVQGYLVHRGRCAKCVGHWTVYGDEEFARASFARFRKCTTVYCRQWSLGTPIDRLTVSDQQQSSS